MARSIIALLRLLRLLRCLLAGQVAQQLNLSLRNCIYVSGNNQLSARALVSNSMILKTCGSNSAVRACTCQQLDYTFALPCLAGQPSLLLSEFYIAYRTRYS
jgi:hypothetical protein